MKNNFDRFLLGILWLLAVTLGACFWFNIRYGFNIFSGAHWKYLAYLQASQNPIQSMFYISLILAVVVAMLGLYLFVRPRRRKIKISAPTRPATPTTSVTTTDAAQTPTQTPHTSAQPTPQAPAPISQIPMTRPMRPNVTKPTSFEMVPPPAQVPAQSSQAQQSSQPTTQKSSTTTTEYPEIREIFTDSGWTVKRTPPIDGVPIALLAIGADEQLWLGGVGISTDDLRRAMDKLGHIFSDTLDDIFININGFVVAARNAATNDTNVLTFNGMSDLAEFIARHKNPTLTGDDAENFNAYSEYIDTVIEYMGKV